MLRTNKQLNIEQYIWNKIVVTFNLNISLNTFINFL